MALGACGFVVVRNSHCRSDHRNMSYVLYRTRAGLPGMWTVAPSLDARIDPGCESFPHADVQHLAVLNVFKLYLPYTPSHRGPRKAIKMSVQSEPTHRHSLSLTRRLPTTAFLEVTRLANSCISSPSASDSLVLRLHTVGLMVPPHTGYGKPCVLLRHSFPF
jgi:hypothetical protein